MKTVINALHNLMYMEKLRIQIHKQVINQIPSKLKFLLCICPLYFYCFIKNWSPATNILFII